MSLPTVTVDEINASTWESVAKAAKEPTRVLVDHELCRAAKNLEDKGDEVNARVLRFIGAVMSMHLRTDDEENTFGPRFADGSSGCRTAMPQDLGDSHLDAISGALLETPFHAVNARCADLLWVCRKDYRAAQHAASEYLKLFETTWNDSWPATIDWFERGLQLARTINAKDVIKAYVELIGKIVAEVGDAEDKALTLSVLKLCLEYGIPLNSDHAELCERIAAKRADSSDFFNSQSYYGLASRIWNRLGNEEKAKAASKANGHVGVRLAEASVEVKAMGHSAAAHHLGRAILKLRESGEDPVVTKNLHRRLLEYQEKATASMESIAYEHDLSDIVRASQRRFQGMEFIDSVFSFAFGYPMVKRDELIAEVEGYAAAYPLSHLFGVTLGDSEGRATATRPGLWGLEGLARREALVIEAMQHARNLVWPMRAQGYILPAMQTIVNEHHPRAIDLQFLVDSNPFIAPGREVFFLRGIVAGFRGDWIESSVMLSLQVEPSIRHVLQRSGHVTSKLDDRLIQDERLLGVLLDMPESEEIFGEDLLFELRGLLADKWGFGLRNQIAHGFATSAGLQGFASVNLWWLVLRILCQPIVDSHFQSSTDEESLTAVIEDEEPTDPASDGGPSDA